jgi:hypothetical protein
MIAAVGAVVTGGDSSAVEPAPAAGIAGAVIVAAPGTASAAGIAAAAGKAAAVGVSATAGTDQTWLRVDFPLYYPYLDACYPLRTEAYL